ncbi:hypothetical protein GSI_07836 [Ganoderma sinense ZZ0214-1]|uniref:Uncharacterized protein n=1 Tax=Ganoderma sinense ZZ0214-1 TaxID=1077348 RepID=A0A2G8S822_9APHY|nr:hypothetical protein GSI_07836 [Ganoderma sinense ZZ0214-1]
MALESGKYTIISKLNDGSVGRRVAEDRSGNPKGIFKLAKDMGPYVTIWEVEKLENGNYKFKANGSVVGAINGLLWAIILENQIENATTVEWTLKRDERDTDGNAYVVMAASQQVGWVAPTGEDEQIAVKPILVGLTIPPTFSPSEVFVFKKWEQESE